MNATPTATRSRAGRPSRSDRTAGTPGTSPENIAPELAALVVPIASLTLHPRNPRRGNLEAITESLRRFGQLRPVVVQKSSMWIVAGNHLVRAARALGWQHLAATVVELDDATASAYLLADNRTTDLGTYDEALLAAILEEQAAAGNLAGTAYGPDDIAELVARVLAEAER
ncbi:MAG TPA: ParB N-terminal domain-containing protein, partial [Coriobacteriia bacterium]